MINRVLVFFFLTVHVAAGPALAGGPPNERERDIEEISRARAFGDLDQNKDGELSREEAEPDETLFEFFHRYDEDGSGHLNPEEYERYREQAPGRDEQPDPHS